MSIEGIKVDGANQPVHNNPEPKIDKTKILKTNDLTILMN